MSKNNYVDENNLNDNLKLTNEEIKQFTDFKNRDDSELDSIREMIYQLSIILYKSSNE